MKIFLVTVSLATSAVIVGCQVCDCIMNSGAQAQAHLTGTKHRHRMDKVEQEMMDKVGVGRSLLDKVGWGRCL